MIVFKLLTLLAGAVTLGLLGYLGFVLDETGYLDQVMAMPKDEIMIYHIAAAAVIVWLLISMMMKVISRAIIVVLLVLAVGAEGMFLGLNINGNIIEDTDLIEQIKDKSEDLIDDLSDKAKDLIDG